jgi:hypothetical protein
MNRLLMPAAAMAAFAAACLLIPAAAAGAQSRSEVEASVYYPGCNEVRAAGRAPLYRGQPGYRVGMDGDGDGIACEPYRGASARAGTVPVRVSAGRGPRRR